MSAGEERHEHAVDDFLLAHHHLSHLVADASEGRGEVLDLGFERRGVGHVGKSVNGDW